jgi:transposase
MMLKEAKKDVINLNQKQKIIMDHLDGVSNRQIASKLHMSKDTVNKYVNEYDEKRAEILALDPSADPNEIIQAFVEEPKYDSSSRTSKKITEDIEAAVEECLRLNAVKHFTGMHKQEMKKIDIYEYLQKNGYDVSYSTVKRLTRSIEGRHAEAFIRQEYANGDVCEFDWGTVKLNIGGTGYRNYQMAIFTAAKSNNRYAKLYMTQDTAAFQESHADFFQYCHGAFHTMVYDNMRVAVRKFVGLTEKEPTVALTELSIYYGFRFRFCNLASGNEKGHVERSVEYVRRKVFSEPGADCYETLADATRYLTQECTKLNLREISNGTVPAEIFEEEKKYLMPAMPKLESCIKSDGHVDKYSTVVVAGNHYSIPDTLVGKKVNIRLYTDKLVIYYDGSIVASHERSFLPHNWKIDIYHYLRTLKRKPGALRHSTALLQLDTVVKEMYERYYTSDARTFLEILEITHEKGVEPVAAALKRLEVLSPTDLSACKVQIICENAETECQKDFEKKPGCDRLSMKSKTTLQQYDLLRKLQASSDVVAV